MILKLIQLVMIHPNQLHVKQTVTAGWKRKKPSINPNEWNLNY